MVSGGTQGFWAHMIDTQISNYSSALVMFINMNFLFITFLA